MKNTHVIRLPVRRHTIIRWFLRKFNIPEGSEMPWWMFVIYYTLFPRILLKVWLCPFITGIKTSANMAALMVNGKPISFEFLERLSRRTPEDGKAFLYQAYSPDIPQNLVYIVEHMPETGDFSGRKIRIY